ncbi:hypothetical protein [Microcystis phage Mel-JY01]
MGKILDIIINLIAKRKVKSLENAFRKNEKFVSAIKDMDAAYLRMQQQIDEYCKQHPEDCEKAEARRKKFGL